MEKLKVVILASDDLVWSYPTWSRALARLNQRFHFTGIGLFPRKTGKKKGFPSLFWYLKTFGFASTCILAGYALKSRLSGSFFLIKPWESLARQFHLDLIRDSDPNSKQVGKWLRDQNADVVLSNVGHILKKSLIDIPKLGCINKHAALLPSCRGLFPYFWARLHDIDTGITFYRIDENIDCGPILYQMEYPYGPDAKVYSLLRFYIDVFSLFPIMVERSLDSLTQGKFFKPYPGIEDSYFSLPTRKDYLVYEKKGYKIAKTSDLFYTPPSNLES